MLLADQPDTSAATQDDFEWVNAWAAQSVVARVNDSAGPRQTNVVTLRIVSEENRSPGASKKARDHQVVLDIVAIMRARDALTNTSAPKPIRNSFDAIPLKGHRTGESVPVILGSVMGLLMIIVFSTAAAFVKLAR